MHLRKGIRQLSGLSMPKTDPSAADILADAEAEERAAEDRKNALREARKQRTAARSIGELRAENRQLHAAVDVLEDHLSVRESLAKAISIPPVVKYRKKKGADAIIPICPNSDEHYDEEFTLEQTNGINEQSPEIAEGKVETYIRRLIRLLEREALDNPVPFMVMPMMGDMIAGELHAKDERASSMTPTEASRFAYKLKRNIIDTLLDSGPVEKIVIPCVDGNHGRTTAKRTPGLNQRYSHEHDVYLRLADWYEETGEKRVQFYIPQTDFAVLEVVPGFRLCITHGDSVKGGSGIGGIAPSLLRAVSRWRQAFPADVYMLGHHHQFWDLGSVLMNPSAVGFNPYAASLGLPPSPPAQVYTAVHTGKMQRAMTCPIWVD